MLESKLINWIKTEVNKFNKNNVLFIAEENSTSTVLLFYLLKKCQLQQINILTTNTNNNINKYINKKINKTINFIEIENYSDDKYIYTAQKIYYLSYFANSLNSVILGSISKNDYRFIRSYDKINGFDILPFADLFQSTIDKLFLNICGGDYDIQEIYKLRLKQNEKRNDIDITNEELEWIYNLNSRTVFDNGKGIIESDYDPTKYPKWFSLTARQKEIIAKTHQLEKISKHKYNPNIPIFFNESR